MLIPFYISFLPFYPVVCIYSILHVDVPMNLNTSPFWFILSFLYRIHLLHVLEFRQHQIIMSVASRCSNIVRMYLCI